MCVNWEPFIFHAYPPFLSSGSPLWIELGEMPEQVNLPSDFDKQLLRELSNMDQIRNARIFSGLQGKTVKMYPKLEKPFDGNRVGAGASIPAFSAESCKVGEIIFTCLFNWTLFLKIGSTSFWGRSLLLLDAAKLGSIGISIRDIFFI